MIHKHMERDDLQMSSKAFKEQKRLMVLKDQNRQKNKRIEVEAYRKRKGIE